MPRSPTPPTGRTDGERLKWLEKHWARHGSISYLHGTTYHIYPADWEVEGDIDKYEDAHHWKGSTLSAAVDDAMEADHE